MGDSSPPVRIAPRREVDRSSAAQKEGKTKGKKRHCSLRPVNFPPDAKMCDDLSTCLLRISSKGRIVSKSRLQRSVLRSLENFRELQPPDNPRPHRSTTAPSRFRLAEVARWPTRPVPASTWKFTKSIEFPLLSETLLAAVTVRPVVLEERKVCSEL